MNKFNHVFPKPLPIALILICIFAILIPKLIYVDHISSSTRTAEFMINKPYLIVVSEMAKKESLEETIEQTGSKLISKEWKNFELVPPDRRIQLREYKLIGDLDFKVSSNDSNLGNLVLEFNQKINLNKKEFKIETKLKNKNEKVLKYNKNIIMTPDSERILNKVNVKITSEIKIKNKIPFFAREIMDEKVDKSNELDLSKIKNFFLKK